MKVLKYLKCQTALLLPQQSIRDLAYLKMKKD